MTKRIVSVLIVAFVIATVRAAQYPDDFAAASHLADRVIGSPTGIEYTGKFIDATAQAIANAMRACVTGRKTETRYHIIFIVSADGRIVRLFSTPDHPTAKCFVKNFKKPDTVPKPPSGPWAIDYIAIHRP